MDFTQYIYNSFAVGRVVFLLVQGRQTYSSHAFIFLLPKISSHPFCMYAKATEQTLFFVNMQLTFITLRPCMRQAATKLFASWLSAFRHARPYEDVLS